MNKKLISILGCATLLVSLSGCGEAKTEPNDGDAYLVEIKDQKITNDDVYNQLVAQGNISPIQNKINVILTDKVFKTTKTDKKEAEQQLASLKQQLGSNFDQYLKYLNVKDDKQLINDVIMPSIKLRKLPTKYFEEDYDNLADEYHLRKMRIIYTNNKDYVKAMRKDLSKGAKFDDLLKYADTEVFNPKAAIYSDKFSSINEDVWDQISELSDNETSKVIKTNANNGYMVVQMVNNDPSKFKKEGVEYLSSIAKNQQEMANQMAQQSNESPKDGELNSKAFRYFLKKYDFSIHDVDVYQALLKASDRYKLD